MPRINDATIGTVDFKAVTPQDSNTIPAEWQSATPLVRSQKRVLQVLIRPLGNNPLNTRKTVELVSPIVRTTDGVSTVVGINRYELRVTSDGNASADEIAADLAILKAALDNDSIESVIVDGTKLI